MEYVLSVRGVVRRRPAGTENPNLPTGEVEVSATALAILNESKPIPFSLEDDTDVAENVRLKYRYLDLRRPSIQAMFMKRAKLARSVREYFFENGFLEVETPVLTKSTPEGARDYLVPSRVNPGMFYALPQSPQLFKQILMIAGYDRYAQIVKCFRDEDLRADRQPEFTQIDVEMSFIDREDIFAMMEGLMARVFRDVLGEEIRNAHPADELPGGDGPVRGRQAGHPVRAGDHGLHGAPVEDRLPGLRRGGGARRRDPGDHGARAWASRAAPRSPRSRRWRRSAGPPASPRSR